MWSAELSGTLLDDDLTLTRVLQVQSFQKQNPFPRATTRSCFAQTPDFFGTGRLVVASVRGTGWLAGGGGHGVKCIASIPPCPQAAAANALVLYDIEFLRGCRGE